MHIEFKRNKQKVSAFDGNSISNIIVEIAFYIIDRYYIKWNIEHYWLVETYIQSILWRKEMYILYKEYLVTRNNHDFIVGDDHMESATGAWHSGALYIYTALYYFFQRPDLKAW